MRRSLIAVLVSSALVASACAGSGHDAGAKPSVSSAAAIESSGIPSVSSPASVAVTAGAHPNVLFVLTDDMRFDDLQFMPTVRSLIGEQGLSFDDYFDNVTLCCPARTSILRGQYSHNTGVLTNEKTNGGFETAHGTGLEDATIATALHNVGYRTGLFGKYLNGYPDTVGPTYVPPGWDTWASSSAGKPYGEFNYTLNENGQQVSYGKTPADYGTDVYVRKTAEFMAAAAAEGRPFFAYLAVYAPHQPATPAPQDANAFPDLKAPRDASFDEADVSDKPEFVQSRGQFSKKQVDAIDRLYRLRAQSLQAVDRSVGTMVERLKLLGQLDNTYIIFTSDNGFHLGQHRLPAGKQTAFETDIHLPLLIRGPGIAAGTHTAAIAGNVDIAPTVAQLANATMANKTDGRSLVATFSMPQTAVTLTSPADWRQVFLLEHWSSTSSAEDRTGATQLEPDDPDQAGLPVDTTTPTSTDKKKSADKKPKGSSSAKVTIPEFQGLRTARYTYVEYVDGAQELYDLTIDPDELDNIATHAPGPLLDELHQRLAELQHCASDNCRAAEQTPLTYKAP